MSNRKKATVVTEPEDVAGVIEELSEEDLAALAENTEPETDENGPVVIGKRGKTGDRVPSILVFESRGRKFGVPKEPSPMLVINFVRDMRKIGHEVAAENAAFAFLGEVATDELAANPEVEPEDIAAIFGKVATIFFESNTFQTIVRAAGNSRRG